MRRARLGTAVLALAGITALAPPALAQETPPASNANGASRAGARGATTAPAQSSPSAAPGAARSARGEPNEPARTTRAEARDAESDSERGAQSEVEDEAPDLAFLEFLGGWQAGDDEWVLISEWLDEDNEARAEEAERADGRPAQRGAVRGATEPDARREREQRKDDEQGG